MLNSWSAILLERNFALIHIQGAECQFSALRLFGIHVKGNVPL